MKKTREIYLEACDQIGADLLNEGFTYARSGPHLTRKRKEWTDKVLFQSSHHNAAGSVVKLWIHIRVANPQFKKWKKSVDSPLWNNPYVAGGQIGNLRPDPGWLDFNLASSWRRKSIVAEAIKVIREVGLSYLDRIDSSSSLVENLISNDMPGFEPADAFEFSLFAAGREMAGRVLRGSLARRPAFAARILRDVNGLRGNQTPASFNPRKVASLARVVVHHDASDLLPR